MTLYKAWSHPFLSIVGGVGRKEEKRKVLISRCTTSGQHLSSIWTKRMKGERNSYWWEENRWQSTEASLRPASGLCSPLFAVLQGLYSTLPPRFSGHWQFSWKPKSYSWENFSWPCHGPSIPQPGRSVSTQREQSKARTAGARLHACPPWSPEARLGQSACKTRDSLVPIETLGQPDSLLCN